MVDNEDMLYYSMFRSIKMAECVPTGDLPFRMLKKLGGGRYGVVYLVDHIRLGRVAYKTCPGASDASKILELEAERHRTLHHPNVVIFYDAVFNTTCCGLFIEYMKYGSVEEFLRRYEVSPEFRIQIIYETACGFFYLHGNEPPIIHGSSSLTDILIGEGFHAKIADFGLSRTRKKNEKSTTNTPLRGNYIHIAPEYFTNPRRRKSEKFDVYGFAISAWEILSQKRAYHDFDDSKLITTIVESGLRPDMREVDESIPCTIKQLIEKCWHQNEEKRPEFGIIKDQLFAHVSQMQYELRQSYASLTDQEQMMNLSKGMKKCEMASSMGDHRLKVNQSTDTTVSSKMIRTSSDLIDFCPRYRPSYRLDSWFAVNHIITHMQLCMSAVPWSSWFLAAISDIYRTSQNASLDMVEYKVAQLLHSYCHSEIQDGGRKCRSLMKTFNKPITPIACKICSCIISTAQPIFSRSRHTEWWCFLFCVVQAGVVNPSYQRGNTYKYWEGFHEKLAFAAAILDFWVTIWMQ